MKDYNEVWALNKYAQYLSTLLLMTVVGIYLGQSVSSGIGIAAAIFSLIAAFVVGHCKGTVQKIIAYGMAGSLGITMAYILEVYTGHEILAAAGITLIVCLVAVYVATRPGANYAKWGIYLFIALLGVIIYEIIALFIALPAIHGIVVGLFTLYVVYDVNRFRNNMSYYDEDMIMLEAVSLYLDIINIFIRVLELIAKKDD